MLLSSFQMQVSAQLSVGHCWYQGREEWRSDTSFVAAGALLTRGCTSAPLIMPCSASLLPDGVGGAAVCWALLTLSWWGNQSTTWQSGGRKAVPHSASDTTWQASKSPAYFHQAVGRKSAPYSLDTTGQEEWCAIASFHGADRSGLRWEIHFLLRDNSYSRITKSKSPGMGHQPWYFQQAFQFILIHSEGESRESLWLLRSPRMRTVLKSIKNKVLRLEDHKTSWVGADVSGRCGFKKGEARWAKRNRKNTLATSCATGKKKKRPPYERFLRSVKFQLNRIWKESWGKRLKM